MKSNGSCVLWLIATLDGRAVSSYAATFARLRGAVAPLAPLAVAAPASAGSWCDPPCRILCPETARLRVASAGDDDGCPLARSLEWQRARAVPPETMVGAYEARNPRVFWYRLLGECHGPSIALAGEQP